MTYTLPTNLAAGDSVAFQDVVQARFYLGATGAVWMTKGLHDFSGAPKWIKIAAISGTAQSMTVSADGNYLFVGTSGGTLYRISNLRAVKDSINGDISSSYCMVESKAIATPGRAITSIAVDPNDANNVLYTLGQYGQTNYMYYSTNALDSAVSFLNKTGDLPKMPVYASVIEQHNPNTVMIGTELGIYSTSNIAAASPSWVEENSGLGRVPVYSLKQQILNYPFNTNYGVIYAGTHGRGAFKCTSYVGLNEFENNEGNNNIGIFPNPASDNTSFVFNASEKGNAVITVLSIDGKVVMSKQVDVVSGENTVQFNVNNLSTGNYIVEVRINNSVMTGKLIKN